MSTRDRLVEPGKPRFGVTLRGIASSALAGATVTSFTTLAFMFFVAFEQDQWSLGFFAYVLSLLQLIGGAWALLVHTPVWLLVERRGWNKYLAMAIEAVATVPVVGIVLAVMGSLTKENYVTLVAVSLLLALLMAGASGLAAKREQARRFGWIIWLAATVTAVVVASVA